LKKEKKANRNLKRKGLLPGTNTNFKGVDKEITLLRLVQARGKSRANANARR